MERGKRNVIADQEQALGDAVQAAKAALLTLLTEDERKTRVPSKNDEHTYPLTFEDAAAHIARGQTREGWEQVRDAHLRYQRALNDFWGAVYRDGLPEWLYAKWKAKYRRLAREMSREDVEAEIVFRLRDLIRDYDPRMGVPFRLFAAKVGLAPLADWVSAWLAGVRVPRAVLRASGLAPHSVSLDAEDGLAEAALAGTRAPVARTRADGEGNNSDNVYRVGGEHVSTAGGVLLC